MAEATVKMEAMQSVTVSVADGSSFTFSVKAANENDARAKLSSYMREVIVALES